MQPTYDGRWIQEAIAQSIGLPRDARESDIDRALYKGTDCGAWIKFDADGILVGTIVEGSDAEFSERISLDGLDDLDQDEADRELCERFWSAVEAIESAASDAWHEANDEIDF
ncbi:MAG: hypothetical protein ACO3CL_08195 [Bacteroidia bacterium]